MSQPLAKMKMQEAGRKKSLDNRRESAKAKKKLVPLAFDPQRLKAAVARIRSAADRVDADTGLVDVVWEMLMSNCWRQSDIDEVAGLLRDSVFHWELAARQSAPKEKI